MIESSQISGYKIVSVEIIGTSDAQDEKEHEKQGDVSCN
jgi:hypothetical protein